MERVRDGVLIRFRVDNGIRGSGTSVVANVIEIESMSDNDSNYVDEVNFNVSRLELCDIPEDQEDGEDMLI